MAQKYSQAVHGRHEPVIESALVRLSTVDVMFITINHTHRMVIICLSSIIFFTDQKGVHSHFYFLHQAVNTISREDQPALD